MPYNFFINRRRGDERRQGKEPRLNPRLDLSHRRRRKPLDRRSSRSISEDFFAHDNSSVEDTHLRGDKH
jgi:hypothetical protein